MKAIYTDLHIHTSEDADKLDENYDYKKLIENIVKFSNSENIMISLTDHNVINARAYENIIKNYDKIHLILGVELHISNYKERDPYHCHMYFDVPRNEIMDNIEKVNQILNVLYPCKMIKKGDDSPTLEELSKAFDEYEYLLLPHGGQSHRTFDKSIPKGTKFDTVMERNIYFNQFDGFTSRSNKGLDETQKYFKRLGISSFINLITCSDNYTPAIYPLTKVSTNESFVPTWMLAEATFAGLRLSLSESSRLIYQKEEPKSNNDYIKSVKLCNDNIDIDVELTPGLNVIIGGSSSGKTLFMDSLYKKVKNIFSEEKTVYEKYNVKDLVVQNPVGFTPHYIHQNYITKVIDEKYDEGIEKIDILKNSFGNTSELDAQVDKELTKFKIALTNMINAVEQLEKDTESLEKIPDFARLILEKKLQSNYYSKILPTNDIKDKMEFSQDKLVEYNEMLEELSTFANDNVFMDDITDEIDKISKKLEQANKKYLLSIEVEKIVKLYKDEFDKSIKSENESDTKKQKYKDEMFLHIDSYIKNKKLFNENLMKICNFSFTYQNAPSKSQEHTLYVENKFELNEEIVLNTINKHLKPNYQINDITTMTPENLLSNKYKQRSPKVQGYGDFKKRIYNMVEELNKKSYKIITNEGKNLDELSPGWKTSIILDIVLGHESDTAPILIDQPEDNLATNYINHGLVKAIKNSKSQRQIIIISHNATIPMLADAQNVIYCQNVDGKITIRSNPLEGKIFNKNVIDHIVEITDGGKSAVKKRAKKYNLKQFRED